MTQSKLKRSNAVLLIILLFTHYDWGRHKYTIDDLNKIEKNLKKKTEKENLPPMLTVLVPTLTITCRNRYMCIYMIGNSSIACLNRSLTWRETYWRANYHLQWLIYYPCRCMHSVLPAKTRLLLMMLIYLQVPQF